MVYGRNITIKCDRKPAEAGQRRHTRDVDPRGLGPRDVSAMMAESSGAACPRKRPLDVCSKGLGGSGLLVLGCWTGTSNWKKQEARRLVGCHV